jgi:hypothetical protein
VGDLLTLQEAVAEEDGEPEQDEPGGERLESGKGGEEVKRDEGQGEEIHGEDVEGEWERAEAAPPIQQPPVLPLGRQLRPLIRLGW